MALPRHLHPIVWRQIVRELSNHRPRCPLPTLPIAAFLDLDNVAPRLRDRGDVRREADVRGFLAPLAHFARRARSPSPGGGGDGGGLETMAFGNAEPGGALAQTSLRCRVCGAVATSTRRERRAGRGVLEKLQTHLEQEHAGEQRRLARKAQRHGAAALSEEERGERDRYAAAVAELRTQRHALPYGPPSDVTRRLRDLGVRVALARDADAALIGAADAWMRGIVADEKGSDAAARNKDDCRHRGILLVCSEDSDFAPLLRRAKEQGFLAVTATAGVRQTRGLVRCADIALGRFGDWTSEEGAEDVDVSDRKHDGEYVIREVPQAPLSLLSSTSALPHSPCDETGSMAAVPVSDTGFLFMSKKRGELSLDVIKELRWDLSRDSDVPMEDQVCPNNNHDGNDSLTGKPESSVIALAWQYIVSCFSSSPANEEKLEAGSDNVALVRNRTLKFQRKEGKKKWEKFKKRLRGHICRFPISQTQMRKKQTQKGDRKTNFSASALPNMYQWKNPTVHCKFGNAETSERKKSKKKVLRFQCKDCGHLTRSWRAMKAQLRKNCPYCMPLYGPDGRGKALLQQYRVYLPAE